MLKEPTTDQQRGSAPGEHPHHSDPAQPSPAHDGPPQRSITRRSLIKTGGALGALAFASGSILGTMTLFNDKMPEALAAGDEKVVWNHCAINCPGRCALKLHVRNDEIIRVESYSDEESAASPATPATPATPAPNAPAPASPATGTTSAAPSAPAAAPSDLGSVQPRACLRGRSYRAWVNHPDRINYPLKRVKGSKRGEGRYERISWDEAIELIASNLKSVIETYGNEAVYCNYGTGVSAVTAQPWERLLNILGGSLSYYGNYSRAQLLWIGPYIFGGNIKAGSTLSAARDAKLILVFGSSPVETRQGGAVSHHDYVALRESTSAKIYVIDPRHNDSLSGRSDEWLPINPGTDAALVAAIAHELITNGWIDLDFLRNYCVGFDEETMPASARGAHRSYRDYILGTGYDQVEKTAEWAAPITGIPVAKIKELAREIGTTKPVFVVQGWGIQRRSNGELSAWSVCMIPILTGNIGLPGTSNGLREGSYAITIPTIPAKTNPIKTKISVFSMVDAVDRGPEMTEKRDGVVGAERLSTGIKFVINYAGNCITNQNSDINWVHDVMSDESKCQFVLGSDILLTDSAKYCDVLLPDLFRLEQVSMIGTGGDDAYLIAGSPATTPKFERKSSYEAATLIAAAFGKEQEFTEGKSQEDWIQQCYEEARAKDAELPPYDELVKQGVYTRKNPKGATVAMADFRQDPVAHPLATPSGKIEIYSEALAAYIETHEFAEDDPVTPIPSYVPEWFGVQTRSERYPLLCSGFHYRGRLHSSWGAVKILAELNPQELWMNPIDAGPRNIASGDTVRVDNEFGAVELCVRVTPRIVPGTVAMPQGAWHDADMSGDRKSRAGRESRVDRGGCINTLTTHRPSPLAKGNPQHTNICQVRKLG